MASFGKPITRATADRLLDGVLERARAYNAESGRIRYVDRLRVFGSYLDPNLQRLGDLDLEIVIGRRERSVEAARAYAAASGRQFNSLLDELHWADLELIRFLKNRSPAVSITQDDVSSFTGSARLVYAISDDAGAIPPPPAEPGDAL